MSRVLDYPLPKEINGKSYVEEQAVIEMATRYNNELDELEGKVYNLMTENEALKHEIDDLLSNQKSVDSDSKLQDRHKQDCIRINDLTTTVHVLAGLYSSLRKNVGMD